MKMTKEEMQVVVDYVSVQHDYLYECIMHSINAKDEEYCRKDELVLRKFLQAAEAKGLNVNGSYSMDKKIKGIDKE